MSVKIAPTDILCELIEVLLHNILFARKLYPETIFSRRRKYGIAVYQCIQPDVNSYINDVLKAITFHSKKNQLKKVFLCFHSESSISEKYVFDIIDIKNIVESDPLLISLEQYMRDFILKLHNTLTYLDDLCDASTFSIRLQVSAYSSLEFNQDPTYEDFPWIQIGEKQDDTDFSDIVPVHSVNSNILKLQIYIEKTVT